MQRDLILAKDTYFVKFNLRELLQGDPAQLGEYIEKLIKSRAMTAERGAHAACSI
jgi:hypothetical protein